MHLLFVFLLHTIHFIYTWFTKARLFWKQIFLATPTPLQAPRSRIPKHLAVTFIIDPNIDTDIVQTTLIENALRIVEWCEITGIPKLTLYEEHDRLSKCVPTLQESLPIHGSDSGTSDSETEYPQKLEKDLKIRRHDLTLCLVSRQSAKPAIASAAHSLAQAQIQTQNCRPREAHPGGTFQLSVDQFDQLLENKDGLSSPDFMIVQRINLDPSIYSTAIELHGFPPWHIRLTEFYQNNRICIGKGSSSASYLPLPLDEFCFKEALDQFSSAEMRVGK